MIRSLLFAGIHKYYNTKKEKFSIVQNFYSEYVGFSKLTSICVEKTDKVSNVNR